MDEKTKKRIEKRAQEILDEDPKQREERTMRMLAERIAYHELKAEEERAAAEET
jgi:hypothetical protein